MAHARGLLRAMAVMHRGAGGPFPCELTQGCQEIKSAGVISVSEFDYSKLDPAFAKLAKPAQRALINAGIFSTQDLARRTRAEVRALHGMGPSAFPVLEQVLKHAGLKFQ